MKLIRSFIQDEQGQGMAEYGLVITLVALVVMVAAVLVGNQILGNYHEISNELPL